MIITPFVLVVLALWSIDLFSHRKGKEIPLKNAVLWSCVYIVAAFIFALYLLITQGTETASLFLTAYLLEKMLSVDNPFVWMAIFSYFHIHSSKLQHRILFWGIIGAIVFRLLFVWIGVTTLVLFGPYAETFFALVIFYTAYLMMRDEDDDDVDYDNKWYLLALRKVMPVTPRTRGDNFFISGKATRLFVCLMAIEMTDILFAFDSVPAVIVITQDPTLIMSAMIFAILGLRSLYFVLSALKRYLVHLDKAVIAILILFSFKILLGTWGGIHIDPLLGLAAIGAVLAIGVLSSLGGKSNAD